MQAELKPLNKIRYWLSQVLGPEELAALGQAEGKRSVVEQFYRKQGKIDGQQDIQVSKTKNDEQVI